MYDRKRNDSRDRRERTNDMTKWAREALPKMVIKPRNRSMERHRKRETVRHRSSSSNEDNYNKRRKATSQDSRDSAKAQKRRKRSTSGECTKHRREDKGQKKTTKLQSQLRLS